MSKRFNPKNYKNKKRIFQAIPGAVGIQRIWCWDEEKSEYRTPSIGHLFVARRYDSTPQGGRKRVAKTFATLEEARLWQRKLDQKSFDIKVESITASIVPPQNLGPTFGEVYESFWKKKISKLSSGTQANYRRYVGLYFCDVMPVPVRAITPSFIDNLLDNWRSVSKRSEHHQSKERISFEHELSVLRSVLRFYGEYYEDLEFRFPLKERHARDAVLRKAPPKDKDISEEEFLLFRSELEKRKHGPLLAALATVQFYQALRISEVAALRFEDVRLDFRNPQESTIRICQHVIFPRTGKLKPIIEEGFKNARGGYDSIKEQPLWRESFEALKSVFKIGCRGLIFGISATEPFSYRTFQSAYDKSFVTAGLSYTGTHIMRHGGTRRVYNATGGDLAIAQQLLGNADLESTLVYAKRDKAALRKHVQKDWKENPILEVKN